MTALDIFTYSGQQVRTPKVKWGGHLYVIEFSTGMVKVGKSQNPAERIETHRGNASAFGSEIVGCWVSEAHDNYSANETLLIRAMHSLGGIANRAEYFMGVKADDAVAAAQGLEFMPIDAGAHEAKTARNVEALKEMVGIPSEGTRSRPADPYEAIDRLFGGIAGTADNAHHFPMVTGNTVPLSMVREMARLKKVPVSEIASMDMLSLLEDTIATRVRIAALNLRRWAVENDRQDLLHTMLIEVTE